jgi:hypothetical protein
MLCIRVEDDALNITVGGSFESEAKELITIPCGRFCSHEVTIAAPLGQRRNTSRKSSADIVICDVLVDRPKNEREPVRVCYFIVCTKEFIFAHSGALFQDPGLCL